ncbi:MAG TPA: TnpV protein [Candidatus Limadaptatus stercoravium]|nr:TnpV protein [Candidatus Limadaptatus stercoravium]
MNRAEVLAKAEKDEGMTVSEIKMYQKLVQPQKHTYGKYGTLAKIYLEEHNSAKLWALGKGLPEYLHGIDEQAAAMYDVIDERLSKSDEFKRTGDFMKDLQREAAKNKRIEEEILNELVYVD